VDDGAAADFNVTLEEGGEVLSFHTFAFSSIYALFLTAAAAPKLVEREERNDTV